MRRNTWVAPLVMIMALGENGCECVAPTGSPDPLPVWAVEKTPYQDGAAWWVQRTVIDAPYHATTFIGDGDLSETIRWRIEERWLIAERADPIVFGVLGDDQVSEIGDYAAPVAVYPIIGHFDVIGGQMIDQPKRNWYEKGWMRVDWGTNMVSAHRFRTAGLLGAKEGVSYWESEPTDENYAIFTPDYIDFTVHELLTATEGVDPISLQSVDCSSFVAYVDCTPIDVTYRTSFRKKPADHQYEEIDEDDPDRPAFFNGTNLFATVTFEIDGERGIIDGGRNTKLLRINTWERSFDDNGDPIPYRQRVEKPIVLHLGQNFPPELIPIARDGVKVWDDPLREVVHELRVWECRDEGGSAEDCAASEAKPETMLLLCENNPVKAGDDPRCGEPGTVVRFGDMRFHTIEWVRKATGVQPIAVAWWSPEMPTGEIVSTHIQFAAPAMDRAAVYLTDLVLVALGRSNFTPIEDPDLQAASVTWLQNQVTRGPNVVTPLRPVTTERTLPLAAGPVDRFTPMTATRSASLAPLVGSRWEELMRDPEDLLVWGVDQTPTPELLQEMEDLSTLRNAYSDRVAARERNNAELGVHAVDVSLPFELDVSYIAEEYAALSDQEIFERLRLELVKTTVMHELGHVLGIRHNFKASFDAINFTPEYWQVRSTCQGPRYRCGYTTEELDAGLHDFAYASIMDYMPRLRATPVGLGPFDKAAIKALYGKMSQVFDDASILENPLAVDIIRGLSSTTVLHFPLILDEAPGTPRGYSPRTVHYSRYPEIFGPRMTERSSVPARLLTGGVSPDGKPIVPFMFCDDRELALFPHCRQFDHGADAYENVVHAAQWGRTYYAVNSFRNGRIDWRSDEAFSSIALRSYNPIKAWNDQYAQYLLDFADYPEFFTDPDGLENVAVASREGFNWMVQLLVAPEAGVHVPTTVRTGSVEELVPAAETYMYGTPPRPTQPGDVLVPLGAGRISRSGFVPDGGGFRLNNIGSFLDKQYALEVLLNPTYWSFPGQETWEAVELWTVNYHVTFPEPLLDVLGAVIADDWDRVAPRLTADGLVHRDYADVNSTVSGTVVSPALGFNLRIRAIAYMLATLYQGYSDRSVIDVARIVRVGSEEDVPSTRTPIDFLDPESGVTYRAYSFLSNDGNRELGIGYRVLERAVALRDRLALLAPDDPTRPTVERLFERQREILEATRGVVAEYDEYYFAPEE